MGVNDVELGEALRRLAERRIEEAMREGKFDNLAGKGRPLDLEPMPADENARMTWWMLRILKSSDFTPDEVRWRKQLDGLRADLASATTEARVRALVGAIKRRAVELGFDLVGIAPAEASRYREYLHRWLDQGQQGAMDYLAKRFEERTRPDVYLGGAASVVCVAMNYFVPLEPVPE